MRRIRIYAKRAWGFLRQLTREIQQDNISTWAAAVSFYGLLSLFPLLLLAVAASAQFLGSSQAALDKVMQAVTNVSPSSADDIRQILQNIIKVRGVVGIVGFASLLWTGSQVFVTFEAAMNAAWEANPRSFIRSRTLALIITLLLGLLGLISVAGSLVLAALQTQAQLRQGIPGWLWSWAGYLLPILISFALYLVLYKVVPNLRVPWRVALIGAVFSTLAWEGAKQGFALYLVHLASYSSLYGSLAGIVILVVWIYYSAFITLIGAELAQVVQKRTAKPTTHDRQLRILRQEDAA